MISLQFHTEVYSAKAIEEASAAFEEVATVQTSEQKPYFKVEITSAEADSDEQELADELANYILGLTIEEKRGAK